MPILRLCYDYKDYELREKMLLFARNVTKKLDIKVYDINSSDIDILNNIYDFNLETLPAVIISFENYHIVYTGELIIKKFIDFFNYSKQKYMMRNVDMICDTLREAVGRAIFNTRTDNIEKANIAINDIIELVYVQHNRLKYNH